MDIEKREGKKLDENEYGNHRIRKNNIKRYSIMIITILVIIIIAKGVGIL